MDPTTDQDAGFLTEEELNALNLGEDPDGESEAETTEAETGEDGDAPAPAEGVTGEDAPGDGEEPSGDDAGGEPKPVIKAKDGVHEIPFEELEKERTKRREAEARLAELEGKAPSKPKPAESVPDKFADLRAMTRTELHEYKSVAEGEDLELVLEFEDVLADERAARRTQTTQAQARIDEFMAKYEIVDGTPKQRHLDRMFNDFQREGMNPIEALERVEKEMVELGMVAAPAGNTAIDPKAVAAKAKGLERNPVAPRTLADAGVTAPQQPVSLDDMDIEEAEAALMRMSERDRARLLGEL